MNVISELSFQQLRLVAVGYNPGPATIAQLERMKTLAARSMEEGAWELVARFESGGPEQPEEVLEVAKVVAKYDGIYVTHIGSEGAEQDRELDFAIRVAQEAKLPVHIFHLKIRGEENWGTIGKYLAKIEAARARGLATLPFTFNFSQREMRIDNRTYAEGQRGEIIENVAVSSDYLRTLGVPLIDGRGIDATDIAGSPDVAVINQTMARRFWPNESAVGHTFTVVQGTRSRTFRIVGVARDHKRHGVLEAASPFVYFAEAHGRAATTS